MKMQGSAQQLKKQSGHILQHPAPRQRPKSNRLSRPHRKPRLHLILLQHKALGKEVLLLKAQLWHLPIGALTSSGQRCPGRVLELPSLSSPLWLIWEPVLHTRSLLLVLCSVFPLCGCAYHALRTRNKHGPGEPGSLGQDLVQAHCRCRQSLRLCAQHVGPRAFRGRKEWQRSFSWSGSWAAFYFNFARLPHGH